VQQHKCEECGEMTFSTHAVCFACVEKATRRCPRCNRLVGSGDLFQHDSREMCEKCWDQVTTHNLGR